MSYETTRVIDGFLEPIIPGESPIFEVEVRMTFRVEDGSFDHAFGTKHELWVILEEYTLVFELNGKEIEFDWESGYEPAIFIDPDEVQHAIVSASEETYEWALGY